MKDQTIYISNFAPIVSSHMYISIQDRLLKNEQFKSANSPHAALEELSGKLKCAECGHAIKSFSRSTNLRPYLSCYGKATLKLCTQSYKTVNFYDLQERVGAEIQNYLDGMESKKQEKIDANNYLAQKKQELESQLQNLIDLAATGGLTAEALKKSIEERQSAIYEIELEIQKNLVATDYLQVALAENAELNFYHEQRNGIEYASLTTEQKKELVKILIDKIILKPSGDFEIIWNI